MKDPAEDLVTKTAPLPLRADASAAHGTVGTASDDRPSERQPLIAREREVGQLRAALGSALAGRGRVVLLGGEPGIGKTRLASVLAAEAESRGVPVWWGRGWEEGSAPAFWPWSTALRRWVDQAGDEAITAAAGPWRADLAHVFPALRDREPAVSANASSESDRERFRLFDIVSLFLAAVAAPAGLVVVLDDVHWADQASLKLLEFLAANVHDSRLLIVATYRDTEVKRDDPFSATLSRLVREPSASRLLLSGLSPEHCAHWLAGAGLTRDVAELGEALHRETNGNPFFVGEIVHLLGSEGGLGSGWDPRRMPQGLREVIMRRLDRLGDGCRDMLHVAALAGDTIDIRLLTEVLDDPAAADHLARAVRDRIVVAVEELRGQYRFAHSLIRRVLADGLDPSARTAWHARIATVLESHAAASDVVTTELVRHFAATNTPEALRRAFDYACQGAEQATRGLGWEEAVRLNEIALDVGTRCGALDAERTIEVKLALARALRGAGEIPAARACCEDVLAACRRTPRPASFARATLIHVGPTPQFGRVAPSERALLEEACRAGGALDDGLQARLLARLASDIIAANETEQTERVLDLCDRAALAARRAGDAGALAMAHLGTSYAAALRLRARASVAVTEGRRISRTLEVVAAAEAAGEYDIAAALRHLRAVGLFASGDRDAFSAEVDGLATAAALSRAPQALWLADGLAALRATVEGRFDEGEDRMERALATGRRMQLTNAIGQHASQRIMWHLVQGRLAEVAGEIEAFVENHPGGNGWQPVRALARLARGDAAGARTEFRTLLAAGFRPAESGVMARCYLAALAHLCVELGEREHAPALYERVARQREAWIVEGCHTLGPWDLVLGALAGLCDRPADAARHFEKAIVLSRRMRARPFIALAQARLAQVLSSLDSRAGEDARVATILDEAEQSARELGLVHVTASVAEVRATLARGAAASVLRCDGEVWSLCFDGREIRVKDGKGPGYLATLLASPGREFHVLELATGASQPAAGAVAPEGLSIAGPQGGVDDAPDARATRQYRDRLEDLRSELDEAEELCDSGRAERLRAELDFLVSQLSQRFGSRPRTRGPAETARKAVTKVLRSQIVKLLDAHPPLGEHLRASLRMGTFCTYAPGTPTTWEVCRA